MNHIAALAVAIALLVGSAPPATAQRRVIINFDRGWKFHLGNVPHGEEASLNDSTWRTHGRSSDRSTGTRPPAI